MLGYIFTGPSIKQQALCIWEILYNKRIKDIAVSLIVLSLILLTFWPIWTDVLVQWPNQTLLSLIIYLNGQAAPALLNVIHIDLLKAKQSKSLSFARQHLSKILVQVSSSNRVINQ